MFADAALPILGLDIHSHYKLFIDCEWKEVVDKQTGRRLPTTESTCSPSISFTVPPDVHPFVRALLDKYSSLLVPVQLSDLKPSFSSTVFHRIDTGSYPPVTAKVRRIPVDKLNGVKAEFSELLQVGVTRPSFSP